MPPRNVRLRLDESPVAAAPIVARFRRAVPELVLPLGLRDDVRAIACRGWQDRTRSEYVGVMVVRRFHGLLVDLNAPLDLQEVALAMLLQEQQHAGFCMAAAEALGAPRELSFDLAELQQARSGRPLETELLELVCGTFTVGEVVAMGLLSATLKALPVSPFAEVLRMIARDEILHARIGSQILGHIRSQAEPRWLAWPGDAWIKRVAQRQIDQMRARDVIEPDEAALFEDDEAAAQLLALGISPSEAFRRRYRRALDEDVPAAFLGAGVDLSGAP